MALTIVEERMKKAQTRSTATGVLMVSNINSLHQKLEALVTELDNEDHAASKIARKICELLEY